MLDCLTVGCWLLFVSHIIKLYKTKPATTLIDEVGDTRLRHKAKTQELSWLLDYDGDDDQCESVLVHSKHRFLHR